MKCPKCDKEGLKKSVMLFVTCDAERNNLSKSGIKARDVEIHFADWPNERYQCHKCGWIEPRELKVKGE